MFKYGWVSALTGFLVSLPVYARVRGSEAVSDVRCVIVGMKTAVSGNSAQQSTGMMAALYCVARRDGREPRLDIEALLAKELRENERF